MLIFLVSLHIVLCALLILIILMQPGKGADISSAFGGGAASQLFGAAGPGNFLTRGTGAIAALFMVTSIALSLYSTEEFQGLGGAGKVAGEVEGVEEGSGFGVGAPTPPAPEAPAPAGTPGSAPPSTP